MFNRTYYDRDLDAAARRVEGTGLLEGKRVLVTGATGLIGSFLVDALLCMNGRGAGIRVLAAGRSEGKMRARFGEAVDGGSFRFVPYDAERPPELDEAPDFVVHAACSAHPLAYAQDPTGVMKANLMGTLNLLEMLRANGRGRMIFLSSGEVYGENPGLPNGFAETDYGYVDPMLPRACYPESKRAAETLCAAYAAQFGAQAMVARLCHVYGPTLTAENSRADAQFLRKALAGEDIVMKSTGAQVRSYCYVADAVQALFLLLEKGERGGAYNVANRHSTASIREYAQTLADIAGVRLAFDLPPEAEKAGYTKITRAVFDPTKLENLGWQPEYDLRAGLESTFHSLMA